jgi:ABC-type dipeptide/oligopeptide/nickel transport system permease component
MPGDPVMVMLGVEATPEEYERFRHILGLDQPIYIQYAIYMQRMMMGDWGQSIFYRSPVFDLVLGRFLNTFILAVCSTTLAFIIGVVLGVLSVWKKGSKLESLFSSVSYFSLSMPVFWLGVILQLTFAVQLKILPALGGGNLGLVLPSLTLATWLFGSISRMTVGSMSDVLNEDYVLTARAKGLSEIEVLLRHVLRNALIPIVTLTLIDFGRMLGGAILTETVFAYPGLGTLLVDSILHRDYPIIQTSIFFGVVCFVLINLFVDVIYTFLDPRIRYERRATS